MIPSSVAEIQNNAFSFCSELKEFEFEKNSKIKFFGDEVFQNSPIKVISFPENLFEFNERWLIETTDLTEIKIYLKNKNFVFYEDKYLIGKSDIKSNTFDILHFGRRDIPPFIRIISPFAFNNCQNLEKVEFSNDSKLQIIGYYSFSDTALESIYIPQSVVEIRNNVFENGCLQKVEFAPNSMLKTICEYAFYDMQITERNKNL